MSAEMTRALRGELQRQTQKAENYRRELELLSRKMFKLEGWLSSKGKSMDEIMAEIEKAEMQAKAADDVAEAAEAEADQ